MTWPVAIPSPDSIDGSLWDAVKHQKAKGLSNEVLEGVKGKLVDALCTFFDRRLWKGMLEEVVMRLGITTQAVKSAVFGLGTLKIGGGNGLP